MSDMTTNSHVQARAKPQRTEFLIYFAIIFAATLPLATITWALAALRSASVPEKGPVKRAWRQASIITPMIFAA